MNKDFIEISDPTIDVEQILKSIESNLSQSSFDLESLAKLQNQRFTPISPEGFRAFDPLAAANAFEKGISPPKFTNPKLWFIRGPIKWVFVSLVNLYSFIDKKLSENRIRAFFSVLHELIRLNRKLKQIESQLTFLQSSMNTEKGKAEFQLDSDNAFYFDLNSAALGLEDLFKKLNKSELYVILLPESGDSLVFFEREQIAYDCYSPNEKIVNSLKKNKSLKVFLLPPGQICPKLNRLKTVLIEKPLTDLTPRQIRFLFSEINRLSEPGTHLIFSISKPNSISAFSENSISICNEGKLGLYLSEFGFNFNEILLETLELKFFQFSKKNS